MLAAPATRTSRGLPALTDHACQPHCELVHCRFSRTHEPWRACYLARWSPVNASQKITEASSAGPAMRLACAKHDRYVACRCGLRSPFADMVYSNDRVQATISSADERSRGTPESLVSNGVRASPLQHRHRPAAMPALSPAGSTEAASRSGDANHSMPLAKRLS